MIKSFKPKQKQSVVSGQRSAGQKVKPFVLKAEEYGKDPGSVELPRMTISNPSIDSGQAVASQKSKGDQNVVRLIPLGGVGDVTRNMFVYEYKNDIVIVDCGVSFPHEGTPGVDLVIPDISYLRDKKHKIRGIVITHGHDDHYGALPYIWPELDVPIYSQRFTCGLIRHKFADHKLTTDKVKAVSIDDVLQLGSFKVSFYQVSHSVPDSTGVVLDTPVGTIIHQADFKIDWTPVNGQVPDVGKVAELGTKGVVFMTIDALRSEKAGYTLSEKHIEPMFEEILSRTEGKLLITTITSNISRIQQAINVAVRHGRKVAVSGRSMEGNIQVARDLGYLDVPNGVMINQEEIKRFADEKLVIVISGALGQPGSALSRVANNDHKYIRLSHKDGVVVSADPMPTAEAAQADLLDALSRFGCKVYYSTLTPELHVSGHAASEEIKLMLNLAKPKYVMPMGGSFKHLRAFEGLAHSLGYRQDQVILPIETSVIEISSNRVKLGDKMNVQNVYVDGLGVGDVGSIVLRDRTKMSEEGVVMVVVRIDSQTGKFTGQPDIISRGFAFGEIEEDLLGAASELVKSVFNQHESHIDLRYARKEIEDTLEKFFFEETKRSPLIITVLVEV